MSELAMAKELPTCASRVCTSIHPSVHRSIHTQVLRALLALYCCCCLAVASLVSLRPTYSSAPPSACIAACACIIACICSSCAFRCAAICCSAMWFMNCTACGKILSGQPSPATQSTHASRHCQSITIVSVSPSTAHYTHECRRTRLELFCLSTHVVDLFVDHLFRELVAQERPVLDDVVLLEALDARALGLDLPDERDVGDRAAEEHVEHGVDVVRVLLLHFAVHLDLLRQLKVKAVDHRFERLVDLVHFLRVHHARREQREADRERSHEARDDLQLWKRHARLTSVARA